jgi:very-short-patch-repair endonuclease
MAAKFQPGTDFTVTRATTQKAQALRRALTPAEIKLWRAIKGGQLSGARFRRQHPIGPYIADFYCAEVKLAIELDGPSHGRDGAEAYDQRRTEFFESKGVAVIRFGNEDMHRDGQSVVEAIAREVHVLRQLKALSLP